MKREDRVEITQEIRDKIRELGDFYPERKLLCDDLKINLTQFSHIVNMGKLQTLKQETVVALVDIYESYKEDSKKLEDELFNRMVNKTRKKRKKYAKHKRTGLRVDVGTYAGNGGTFKRLEVGKSYRISKQNDFRKENIERFKIKVVAEYKRFYEVINLSTEQRDSILKNDLYKDSFKVEEI